MGVVGSFICRFLAYKTHLLFEHIGMLVDSWISWCMLSI